MTPPPVAVVDRTGRVWTRSPSGRYRRRTGSGVIATICDDESLPRRIAQGLVTPHSPIDRTPREGA